MAVHRYTPGCPCCTTPACSGTEGDVRHYWTEPPSEDYVSFAYSADAEFEHDDAEAVLTLAAGESAALTIRKSIEPALPVVPANDGYDLGGHFVYILAAAVRRVAGSIQGVAIFGRYALMFHDDELKWKVHEVTTGGVLGDPLAELTVQDYSRTAATLYLVRSQDNTVKLRMMASFCTAAPMEFVDHDPGEWPTSARVGLLGHGGGSWEYWRVGCGFHKHRCVDGGDYHSGGEGDEDLIHAANHHAAEFVTEGYPLSGGALSGFPVYDPADWDDNSGSIYTEIHNTDGPDFGDIGQILIQGSIGWQNGALPGLQVGIFVGNDMIVWEPGVGGTGMFSYAACSDAGVPGALTPVRDQRQVGSISQMVFTVRRVAYQGGYNLLFYWQGRLIYTKSVAGEQQIFRAGVYWADTSGWIVFGSPKWSCAESVVVPCANCPEELRRNPPIGWRTTITISETVPEVCEGFPDPVPCENTQDTITIVNAGCSWSPMGYYSLVPDVGIGSPPLTASSSHLVYGVPDNSGIVFCEEVLSSLFALTVGCEGCGANLNILVPLVSPGWNYEPIDSGYAGGGLTLNVDATCNPNGHCNPVVGCTGDGCEPPDSITLTPIYAPIVWLHTP